MFAFVVLVGLEKIVETMHLRVNVKMEVFVSVLVKALLDANASLDMGKYLLTYLK